MTTWSGKPGRKLRYFSGMASSVHTRLRELTAPASDDPTMPVDFSRRRWVISRPAAVVLCTVFLVVLAVAGVSAGGVSKPEAAVVPTGEVLPAGAAPPNAAAKAGGNLPPAIASSEETNSVGNSDSNSIVVSVVGLVHRPGVVTLAAGARVNDAITAAGGFRPKANPASVNLARPLADGEQIEVTDKADPAANSPTTAAEASAAPGKGAAASGGGATAPTGEAKVNINSATATELESLPGVGPTTAAAIIAFREENGPFTSVAQLGEVSGIGPKKLEKLTKAVTV